MRVEYDQAADSLYVRLDEQSTVDASDRMVELDLWQVDGLVDLHLDGEGRIVGIQFDSASRLLPREALLDAESLDAAVQ
jgi:uncharacterized protein YuzE